MIRILLPTHLRRLAGVGSEVSFLLSDEHPATQRMLLDELEARYPMLKGTIRDHASGKRRGFVRFFACQVDVSDESPDTPLPDRVLTGEEPFMIVGALAGG
jgi:hypothetical protein